MRGTPGRSLAPSSWLRGTQAQERVARPGLGPHNTQPPRGASTRGSCSVTDRLLVVTLDQSFKHHFESQPKTHLVIWGLGDRDVSSLYHIKLLRMGELPLDVG